MESLGETVVIDCRRRISGWESSWDNQDEVHWRVKSCEVDDDLCWYTYHKDDKNVESTYKRWQMYRKHRSKFPKKETRLEGTGNDRVAVLPLEIRNFSQQDEGQYTCKAKCEDGSSTLIYTVVSKPREFNETTIPIIEGTNYSLSCYNFCNAISREYLWKKQLDRGGILNLNQSGSTLQFRNYNRREDGKYYCISSLASNNKSGSTSYFTYRTVAVWIETQNNHQKQSPGCDKLLRCDYQTTERNPTTKWYLNDTEITPNPHFNLSTSSTSTFLHITKITPQHFGIYSCELSSSRIRTTIHLSPSDTTTCLDIDETPHPPSTQSDTTNTQTSSDPDIIYYSCILALVVTVFIFEVVFFVRNQRQESQITLS